ncbi:MAG: tyrosine-type recombinase/integrase [Propionicimonas sp.]
MAGLAERYLTYLAEDRRFSPNTIATYRRTFATFPDMETASREQVESWWAGRVDKAVTTRRNELSAIRSFYRWCREWDHRPATDDPTHRIKPPKQGHRLPRPIGREDLHRILSATSGDVRRAVCLGAYGGLRVAEAAELDWLDVDMESRRIIVRGKGDKDRMVGLTPLLLDSLLPMTGGNVVTAGGKPYTANALQQRVNAAIRAAGVDSTFHKLRSRYATVALAATGNLLAVSRALGHSSPATTAIYAATADSDLDLIAEAVAR